MSEPSPRQADFGTGSLSRRSDTPREEFDLPSTSPRYGRIAGAASETCSPTPQVELGYEILEELGHGGMGIVYRARDITLKREVALKCIKSGALTGPEVSRFYREAEAAARLHHPNIVPVYAIDQLEGSPCYTMPLVLGGTVAQARARYHANPRETAALVEKVARAVHAAHGAGVIHRDLKPGNILLDERGEPLVADFGLAKIVDTDGGTTRTYAAIGTPAYMAPEQVAGHAEQVGPSTDTWALGVILYELLTGKRPFLGPDYELGSRIVRTDPPPPRALLPTLPRDLDTIVMKCLEKEPAKRYASAEALADDLARFLRKEPIAAPRRPWLIRTRERLTRAWRKRSVGLPAVLLGIGAVAGLALAALLIRKEPTPDAPAQAQQALAGLYRQLDAGLPATLMDEAGRERWYRWVTPRDLPPLRPAIRGYRALPAVEMTLLELLPDPRSSRWMLSADVLYLQYPRLGRAGIYVMGQETATPFGPVHQFVSLALIADKQQDGFVRLSPLRHRKPNPKAGEVVIKDSTGGLRLPLAEFGKWHTLTIKASPDELEAALDKKPVQKIKRARMDLTLELQDRQVNKQGIALPRAPFKVRGSMGLYVSDGRALFRNVVLKPLPQP
jgi:serine/threonine protein kinase